MKIYSIKSNARRAARNEGLDPDQAVKAVEGGFVVESSAAPESPAASEAPATAEDDFTPPAFLRRDRPEPEAEDAAKAEEPSAPAPAKARKPRQEKVAGGEATPPRENKTETLIDLLRKGATVEELTGATGWLPHTLRARISGLAKEPHNLQVERTRKDGVTSYKVAA